MGVLHHLHSSINMRYIQCALTLDSISSIMSPLSLNITEEELIPSLLYNDISNLNTW